jgi:GSH-dependent disulfide-bond oxidoreductase
VLKFFFHPAPNPMKVALFLEESGLPYEVVPIDMRKGDQFKPEFLAINPNAKTPAILDGDIRVFDSNAILLYLAEKTGRFLPEAGLSNRGELLSWLMFIASGIGPYSGQAVHFGRYAPKGLDYAVKRYDFEARRHWEILEAQAQAGPFLLGDTYTIIDMAAWGWARAVPFVLGEKAWETLPHLKRWFDLVNTRPAAQRAEALKEKHVFKAEMDDEARRHLFRHISAQ